ncbi:hypothetical protein [Hymenobacter terrestris]|uniref:Prevent-host-death protein n=1 Tax=Hymenobacter terrestris TaxID=2748310 RepID=A0ABX2PXG1_9BACT|nr:hypothetical protein [Hymenobacter terrestris]NVO83346.1 hypothetical protein [Hymenobacter terrestris]
MAAQALHYLTDETGKPEAVVIPIARWKELEAYYAQLRCRDEVLEGMRSAVLETRAIEAGEQPGEDLHDFLDSL